MHSNISSQHNQMSNEACPSWDCCNHTCTQVKEGLFLPVVQHVVAYCQSNQYPFCPHYKLETTAQTICVNSHTSRGDRRRANRVSAHFLFRFSEMSISDLNIKKQQNETWTIDLSEMGACFASTKDFRSNTTIHFSLEIDDVAQKIEGIGQVIWSTPLANTPLFHTGIAFIERRTSPLLPHRYTPNQY